MIHTTKGGVPMCHGAPPLLARCENYALILLHSTHRNFFAGAANQALKHLAGT